MKSSGFGTSGVVLMAMSVVAFGLAIGVVFPIFFQNQAVSITELRGSDKPDKKAARYSEFFPRDLIAQERAKDEPPTYVARHTMPPARMGSLPAARTQPRKTAVDPFRPAEPPQEFAQHFASSVAAPSPEAPAGLLRPNDLPGGSVYAPVTVNVDSDQFSHQLEQLAARIEKAVAQERPAPAPAPAPAKERNKLASRDRRTADRRQIQQLSEGIYRLEQTVQRIQSETAFQLQSLSQQAYAAPPSPANTGRIAMEAVGSPGFTGESDIDVSAQYYVGDPADAQIPEPQTPPATTAAAPEPQQFLPTPPPQPEFHRTTGPELPEFPEPASAPEENSASKDAPNKPAAAESQEAAAPPALSKSETDANDTLDTIQFPELPADSMPNDFLPARTEPTSDGPSKTALALEIPGLDTTSVPDLKPVPTPKLTLHIPPKSNPPAAEPDPMVDFHVTQESATKTHITKPTAESIDLKPVPDKWFTPTPVAYSSTYRFQLDVTENNVPRVKPASGNVCPICGIVHAPRCGATPAKPLHVAPPSDRLPEIPPPAKIPSELNPNPVKTDFEFASRSKSSLAPQRHNAPNQQHAASGRPPQQQRPRHNSNRLASGNTPQSAIKTVSLQESQYPAPRPVPSNASSAENFGTVEYELPTTRRAPNTKPTTARPPKRRSPPQPSRSSFLGRLGNAFNRIGR